jgi:hypothetical protein
VHAIPWVWSLEQGCCRIGAGATSPKRGATTAQL